MRIEAVEGVKWQEREITVVMILRDGPLSNESVVFVPTFHLLQLAKYSPTNTLLAVASDLKSYFEALEEGCRKWDEISDDEMSGYIETTLLGKLQLSKRSIVRHCSSLKGLYTQLSKTGFTDKYFDFTYRYYDKDGVEEQGDAPPSRNFRLRKRYINNPLFEILLEYASETPGFLRARNELILHLGHKLGLRSFEVTHQRNLKLSELNNLLLLAEKNNKISTSITIFGKRKKVRDVDVSPDLLVKISSYIERYRKNIPGDNLICAQDGSNLGKSFACRLFKRVKYAALPKLKAKLKELFEQEDAPYTISWPSAQRLSFHCLRHSYSTNLVTYCYRCGIDPLSYLPSQLGHIKAETTRQYINFHAAIYNSDVLRSSFSVEMEKP